MICESKYQLVVFACKIENRVLKNEKKNLTYKLLFGPHYFLFILGYLGSVSKSSLKIKGTKRSFFDHFKYYLKYGFFLFL